MNLQEARGLVVTVLTTLGYNTDVFVNLLLATMAQESHLGLYETQVGGGPGRGIFQMENATFQDIYTNFLSYHKDLAYKVNSYQPLLETQFSADWLIHYHKYATAVAACSYIRHHVPSITVDAHNPEQLWPIYKQYYNTYSGAASKDHFLANWNKYVVTGDTQ